MDQNSPTAIKDFKNFHGRKNLLNNIEIVKACQEFFSFELPSEQLAKRVVKFESKGKRVTV